MIWLPEIDQARLNLLCHIIFAATADFNEKRAQAGAAEAQASESAEAIIESRQITHIEGVYKTFLSRAENISSLAGQRNSTVDVTNPAFFAQSMLKAAEAGVSTEALASRIDGIRFLPLPRKFKPFVQVVRADILSQHPIATWVDLLPADESSSVAPEHEDALTE